MDQTLKKIWKFISHDIWHTSVEGMSKSKAIFIKNLRVLILSIRGYIEDKIAIRASALTFFTLLSIVPIFAMVFAIAKGFGAKQVLQDQLRSSLEGQEEVFNYIVSFADRMLENTQGGWLAGVGILVLLWSVVKVLWYIEISFNDIWNVKKERTPIRKLSDYLSIIIIGPILIILSGSMNIFITTQLSELSKEIGLLEKIGPFILFLLKFAPFVMIWVLLTLLYMVMPNTFVKFRSALVAGIIAGSVFQLVQWAYIEFQIGVSQYNAIYGGFAAIPLFLFFLQIAWIIVLWGAELSFAHQNVSWYEYESDIKNLSPYKRKLTSLTVMHAIIKAFERGEKLLSGKDISEKYKAPIKLVEQILEELKESGLIIESTELERIGYAPATDIHKIDINYVLTALGNNGSGNIRISKKEPLESIIKNLEKIRHERKASPANKLLMEIKG